MSDKIEYFVSYSWNANHQSGDGMVNITMDNPIKSFEDIILIKEQNFL